MAETFMKSRWTSHVQEFVFDHVLDWLPDGIDVYGRRENVDAIEATFTVFVAVDLGDELDQEVALARHRWTNA